MNRRDLLKFALGASVLGGPSLQAWGAGDLPKLITIVLPFTAGGPLDNSARLLAEGMASATGKNVIVNNKVGAGGLIAAGEVARAKPDGASLLFTTGGHTTLPILRKKMPYDVRTAFTPITLLYKTSGFLLLVPHDSPFQSMEELLDAARKNPGTLSYASAGMGNTTHLIGALLEKAADIQLTHVPYKGASMILSDMLGGRVDMTFLGTSLAMPYLESDKVRALVISGTERAKELPDVPSLEELNIKGVDVPAWIGLFGPAGMPEKMVDQLYESMVSASQEPKFRAQMERDYAEIVTMPPREFSAYVTSELDRYQEILPKLGIRL